MSCSPSIFAIPSEFLTPQAHYRCTPSLCFLCRVLLLLAVVAPEFGPLGSPEQYEGSGVVGGQARFLLLGSCLVIISFHFTGTGTGPRPPA